MVAVVVMEVAALSRSIITMVVVVSMVAFLTLMQLCPSVVMEEEPMDTLI